MLIHQKETGKSVLLLLFVFPLTSGQRGAVDDQAGSGSERLRHAAAAAVEHEIRGGNHGAQCQGPVRANLLSVLHATEA